MLSHYNAVSFQDFLTSNSELNTAFKSLCSTRNIRKDNIIVGHGAEDKDMYVLTKGKAKVVLYSEGGNEVHLAQLNPGTIFGEMAMLLGQKRSSNVIAQTECCVDIISAAAFKTLLEDYPELGLYMTHMLAQRLQETSQSLYESLVFSVPQRVYETLLRRGTPAESESEIYKIMPPPSVTHLSESLNISREATSRAITKLKTQGLLAKHKSHWNILKPQFPTL
jgi:CRP-like cAMP-binding protein